MKDSFDVAGRVSTWGTLGRAGFRPDTDATAVARLRAAGAIVIGRTNTPELTLGFETWNPITDLVVSPPHAQAALRHGESDARMASFSYTMTWNLSGWPGAVVRAGTSPEGLPIGVQLVAPPWREDLALQAAACVEATLGGFSPPPLEEL